MKPFFRPLLPLIFALLLAIPVPARAQGDKSVLKLKTVVIDAGHGGKDAGCVSRDKKTYEKNVTLDIAKRLEQKIKAAYPDVTVKMTRSTDKFVELENRAVIANKAGANLFISIHVNSIGGKSTAAKGFSVHGLGQSAKKGNDLFSKNLDLVKRENSVIMLEENYKTKYQGFDPSDPQSYIILSLMQNAHLSQSLGFAEDVADALKRGPIKHNRGVSQDPFWVLWRTAMPSVLIEVGFMSNPEDLATMRSEKGRDGIAEGIYQAFKTFKARYDGGTAAPLPAPAPEVEEEPADKAQPAKDGVLYGIQVLATGKNMDLKDPYFLGYQPTVVPSGKLKKYVICTSASLSEVKKKLPQIQKKIKDCYVVKIEDGVTTPIH
jgi:N-acetylmuramoyl-L-alanine amidase